MPHSLPCPLQAHHPRPLAASPSLAVPLPQPLQAPPRPHPPVPCAHSRRALWGLSAPHQLLHPAPAPARSRQPRERAAPLAALPLYPAPQSPPCPQSPPPLALHSAARHLHPPHSRPASRFAPLQLSVALLLSLPPSLLRPRHPSAPRGERARRGLPQPRPLSVAPSQAARHFPPANHPRSLPLPHPRPPLVPASVPPLQELGRLQCAPRLPQLPRPLSRSPVPPRAAPQQQCPAPSLPPPAPQDPAR